MASECFVRVLDLGLLPELLEKSAGPRVVERAFRRQGLAPSIMHDPFALMTRRDYCGLHEWAARLSGRRDFGLDLGAAFVFEELGPAAAYLASVDSVGAMIGRHRQAIDIYAKGAAVDLRLTGDIARYVYSVDMPLVVGSHHVDDHGICRLIGLIRRFAGPDWKPLWIEVEYPRARDSCALEDAFGVEVRYDQPAKALAFPADDLAIANPALLPASQHMTLGELTAALKVRPPVTTADSVQTVLALRLLDGSTDMDETAAKLGLSRRTLQRRLHKEGTDYRELLNAARLQRAMSLLLESSQSIETIALNLGYSSTAHFTRAFTRWAGRPPSAIRTEGRR
jgi:AraC-like DNA-binding protein